MRAHVCARALRPPSVAVGIGEPEQRSPVAFVDHIDVPGGDSSFE